MQHAVESHTRSSSWRRPLQFSQPHVHAVTIATAARLQAITL